MRRIRLYSVLACVAIMVAAAPLHAASIFLGDTSSPTHSETYAIDISGGGTGLTFGVWVAPDTGQTLNGVDLNLRIDEQGGNAIDFTGATVHNPANASSQRWFLDNNGTNVDSVAADLITGMIGATTTGTGAPGEGTGIDDTNSATDPGFDAGTGAYLFATVTYDVINTGDTANLFLQISDAGVSDTTGLDTAVILGLADPALDASDLGDRNVDSATEDGAVGGVGCASPYTADFDCDIDVDPTDLLIWQGGFPTASGATRADGDADSDGDVDPTDLLIWQGQFPSPGSASAASVPEPATATLLALALVGLAAVRRRK